MEVHVDHHLAVILLMQLPDAGRISRLYSKAKMPINAEGCEV
jgi:hypothetical protein